MNAAESSQFLTYKRIRLTVCSKDKDIDPAMEVPVATAAGEALISQFFLKVSLIKEPILYLKMESSQAGAGEEMLLFVLM